MAVVMVPDSAREEGLRQLMRAYKNDLMRMCFACLKDLALAEDAVEDLKNTVVETAQNAKAEREAKKAAAGETETEKI